jgi:hypothetical protein
MTDPILASILAVCVTLLVLFSVASLVLWVQWRAINVWLVGFRLVTLARANGEVSLQATFTDLHPPTPTPAPDVRA